ncbi:Sigma-70, region 4 [compost metagenome]
MLLAARVHELPHAEIARRYGVSERIVSKELKRALEHCARELQVAGAGALPGRAAGGNEEPWH